MDKSCLRISYLLSDLYSIFVIQFMMLEIATSSVVVLYEVYRHIMLRPFPPFYLKMFTDILHYDFLIHFVSSDQIIDQDHARIQKVLSEGIQL